MNPHIIRPIGFINATKLMPGDVVVYGRTALIVGDRLYKERDDGLTNAVCRTIDLVTDEVSKALVLFTDFCPHVLFRWPIVDGRALPLCDIFSFYDKESLIEKGFLPSELMKIEAVLRKRLQETET